MNFIHKHTSKSYNNSGKSISEFDPEESLKDEKILEAVIFSSKDPVSIKDLQKLCPFIKDIDSSLKNLISFYENRSINIVKIKNTYTFRTSPLYGSFVSTTVEKKIKLSKAAKETLAVIAYHQPITRTESEDVRGVSLYKGLMDTLLDAKWVTIGPRRDTPGMPVTYKTTDEFLDYFGLNNVKDLPNFNELKEAGFLSGSNDDKF